MKSLRRWSGLAVAAAVALASQQAGAQVMNQVPEGAMVVLKVANLQKTSGKLASLSQKMGIAQMVPQLQDPLGALKQKLHDPKGLNEQGDMAFVFINPDLTGGDNDKSMLVLLPVSDYQAFLGNLHDTKTDGDVTEGRLPDQHDTAFVAHWGDYVAMSPSKEIVAKKPEKVLQPAGVTAKELEEKDVVVYANFAQIRDKAIPALQQNKQKIINNLEKGMAAQRQRAAGGDNAEQPATAPNAQGLKALVGQGLNFAQQFLQDAQAATWGLNLADDGIKSSLVVEFDGKSYFGQMASSSKNTDQSLLGGLPGGNYLVYGGLKINAEHATKLVDDLGGPVIKDLKAAGTDTAALEKYVASVKEFYTAAKSMRMGMVAPAGALGQEALFQTVGVIEGNADQVMASAREMSQSQSGLAELLGQPKDQTTVTVTPNAKTVEGVAFDQTKTTFHFAANNPQAAQAQQMMTLMYGPDGMNMYTGKIDDNHVLVVSGASDEVIAKAVKAAKAGEDALDKQEQLKAVNAQLPGNRLGVMYFPIDNLVMTGVSYAKQFGMPIQVQLPPNLPPIGTALSADGNAYRVDGYVPAQLVQSLVSAGMQAFMAMQGGGGGQQPGGPGGL